MDDSGRVGEPAARLAAINARQLNGDGLAQQWPWIKTLVTGSPQRHCDVGSRQRDTLCLQRRSPPKPLCACLT